MCESYLEPLGDVFYNGPLVSGPQRLQIWYTSIWPYVILLIVETRVVGKTSLGGCKANIG